MKVIANRFKHIFPKIIAQEQTGFIAGRNITDNIIIAQEVIHSMRCQKNRKWMTIIIDLEKAYDRVRWDFIHASLYPAGPQRVRFFIWTALQGRLLSNVEPAKRGLEDDPSCSICGFHSKDILLILRDCVVAKEVWSHVLSGNSLLNFFSSNLQDWLLANLQDNSMVREERSSWACLFGLIIWHLWKNCNLSIFQGRSWSTKDIIQVSLSWANQFFSVPKADVNVNFKSTIEEDAFEDLIFLNTDGVVQIETENVAAGGVVRKANGDWILGYNSHLGKCSAFNPELWGILEGLRLIQQRGHDKVIIQFDSLEVVKAILDGKSNKENSALIRRIHSTLLHEKLWCLRYIPRDQNQVADCLAKQTLSGPKNLQVFDSPHLLTHTLMDSAKIKNVFSFWISNL
ncbi:hypothetical protein J1N35_041082 [Gossypium stocksii]|uniref:RNase H type-1 domain-containing protein n=1 Tax=Gossypium stocksii TaxID=47602 RepID=A0A9D3UFB9_9ROSI|nr:hypothetical protein J1N35_041082 [Gossypium stocksii]